jgi:hypothetical protein
MKPITRNGHNYTELYAWYPIRTTLGAWIWLQHYYIRPDRYFEGRLLTRAEMLAESTPPEQNHAS